MSIREILEKLVRDPELKKYPHSYNPIIIEQAEQAILAEFERMLPENKFSIARLAVICSNIDDAVDYGYEKGTRDGYNQAIQDIKAKLHSEGLRKGGVR